MFDLTSVDGTNGIVIDGVTSGDRSGTSVASLDFDGDGFSDLLIGAPNAEDSTQFSEGEFYIVFGDSGLRGTASVDLAGLNGTNGIRFTGEAAGDSFGASLAGAGDVNDDGFEDLIVGGPFTDVGSSGNADRGAAYVVFGGAERGGLGRSRELPGWDERLPPHRAGWGR